MPDVDTSIYKPQPRQDVFGRLGGVVNVGNALLSGQLARQTVDANQGVGDALKAGIDPATGTFDPATMARAIKSGAADPGYQTGAVLGEGNTIQSGATGNARDQTSDFWRGLGATALTDPNLNHAKAVGLVNSYNKTGRITPSVAANILRDIPSSDDPQVLHQYIAGRMGSTLPEGGASLVPGPLSASGAPTQTTTGAMVGKMLNPDGTVPPAAGPGAAGAVPRPNGGQPGAASAGTVQMGFGVGTQKLMQDSVDQYSADRTLGANFQAAYTPLTQAIDHLEKLGPSGTGPGTQEYSMLMGFLQAFAPGTLTPDRLKTLNDYQSASKYIEQIASQAAASIGPHTNAGLDAAFKGNASMDKTQDVNLGVLKKATSLLRMRQAQQAEFARQGGDPTQYANWSQKWAVDQDPRAYGVDLMSKKQQQDLYKGLSGDERKKFNASLKAAIGNGLVSEESIVNAR